MGNTEQAELKEVTFKLHVAIDFGTDGCGLAFAYKDKVYIYDKWKTNKRQRTKKTKTHILLNDKNEVVCFGNSAKYMYSNLAGTEKKTWRFFERFKMALYDGSLSQSDLNEDNKNNEVDTVDKIKSSNGITLRSETVFVAAFQHLQGLAKEYLPKVTDEEINDNEIQWIVTVPAIWSETAKDKMKRWIIKAGLVDEYITNQCLIVYEPDCASLAIQKEYFKKENVVNKDNDEKEDDDAPDIAIDYEPGSDIKDKFEDGDKYILIDAGGGTVDIACHEVQNDGSVQEMVYPTGDKWGSCYIDDLYIQLLQEIFTKEWIDEFNTESPNVYVDIMDNFQFAKSTFYENAKAKTHSVQLPFEFVQFLEEKCGKIDSNPEEKVKGFRKSMEYFQRLFMNEEVEQKGNNDDVDAPDIAEQTDDGKECVLQIVTTKNEQHNEDLDYLEMDTKIWQCLFDSKINNIINHIHKLLAMDSMKNKCDYLCLVGGFSGSLYFQQRMQNVFGVNSQYKLRLIIPRKPILSVVEGAAYFGITDNYITARKLKYTYGIKMYFGKSQAKEYGIPDSYINNNDNISNDGLVMNCFKVIAHKNERVAINEVKTNTSFRRSQISLIPVLFSNKQDPKIASDGHELAILQVPHNDAKRETITEFHFYGTMFKVYAYAKSNPNAKQAVNIKYVK